METEATYDVLYDICAELWTLDLGGKTPQEIASDCDLMFNELRQPVFDEDEKVVDKALSYFKYLKQDYLYQYHLAYDDLLIDYKTMRILLVSAIKSIMTNPQAIKEDK